MYLKRLEVQGFKSFADKVILDYNKGITAVVGPNGSGKSNIADAVRWVLGEQSARTLRGNRMEDVIFIGTEHRKALGFAEVSLVIDNQDGKLPVEYSEVTITRRVFRSGESEYCINKTQCRLKDINELFLDTGIGKDGYSIIGQGRVDEILSNKSEDRRHIFEEASGIMKFKIRKQEAEKKLDLTEQNLLRIMDISNELELQIGPLKEQSDIAKKYLSIRDNLKILEVNVYIEQISKFKEKLKDFEVQYKSVEEQLILENKKLDDITSHNKVKTEKSKELEEILEKLRNEFYSIESNIEKISSEVNLLNERILNLENNNNRISGEIEELEEKLKNLNEENIKKSSKLKYLESSYEDYNIKLIDSEEKLKEVMSKLDDSEKYIENLKSLVMDKLDEQSEIKTQVNNIKNQLENSNVRQNRINSDIYEIVLDKDRDIFRSEDIKDNIDNTKNIIKDTTLRVNNLNDEKKNFIKDVNLIDEELKKLNQEHNLKSNRRKILKEMESKLEGYQRSVKEILKECENSNELKKGIKGALAQLIKVSQEYEVAIEMSLGGALQNIVTLTEEYAKIAIEFLKRNKLGRATFLPMSAIKGKTLEYSTLSNLKNYKGFIGVASDLLLYDDELKGIVQSLLGRTIIVDNLDSGIEIARKFSYGFRIVTLEGDILNAGGSMSGGSKDLKSTGILSRQREIATLDDEITILYDDIKRLEKNIEKIKKDIEEIDNKISNDEIILRNSEHIKIRDESQYVQLIENIKKHEERILNLNKEIQKIDSEKIELENSFKEIQIKLQEVEKTIVDTKEIISNYQDKHKEGQSERDRIHRDITDYKISVNSIKESIDLSIESIEKVKNELISIEKSVNKRKNESELNNKEIESNKFKINNLENTKKNYDNEKIQKQEIIEQNSIIKKKLDEEISTIVEKITNANKTIILLQEEFNRVEVKKAKIESEMESMQNRMWDEYELTFTNALELKQEIGSINLAQKRIIEYRNEIKALGPINVTAIEDYVKTKERFEFVVTQREDLESGKEKLKKVIQEMTAVMRTQFLEQFKLINDNFNIVFRELFDGGRAELILVNKDDVLESGIEIEVQPPGKKLQNMMLLSGGERAFTAIALLFSILRLKPTPFCILDEIEAALDDANVSRFGQYLKRFINQTQFIMITHRKGTMEAADALYGVTMQEHGISKVVSMKLGEKAS